MSPEERIAGAVATWLRDAGWTVYAEVTVPGSLRRADIVATRPATLATLEPDALIVEAKTSLTWDLIGQADEWRGWAHFVTVATGTGPKGRGFDAAVATLRSRGFGWIVVLDDGAHQLLAPIPNLLCRRVGLLLDALRPEHAASRPGNADSAYYRERDERDARIRALVAERPGVELRAALDALGMRVTPDERRALARALLKGCVDGVAAKRDGRRVFLAPAERTF